MNAATEKLVNEAISALSMSWTEGVATLVSLPVQYPSGGLVVLEITTGRQEVHITDRGMGMWEAEQLCSDTSFSKFALHEAAVRGISFDGSSVLALKLPTSSLAAGMVAVANASASAAAAAIRSDAEKRTAQSTAEVFNRVRLAFPDRKVHKELSLFGERVQWQAHNVVNLTDNRILVFEPLSDRVQSISSKFLMFSDLARREDVGLHAVFTTPEPLSPKAQMLSEFARVLHVEDAVDEYRLAVA